MKTKTVLGLLCLCVIAAAPPPRDEGKRELARLQGEWVMAGLEVNGETVPEGKLKGTTLTIRGDKYAVKVKKTTHETTIKLYPEKSPKAIDMFFPDGPDLPRLSEGVYEVDGDTLKICRRQTPGEPRPTKMGTWPDTDLFVVTWKRKPK